MPCSGARAPRSLGTHPPKKVPTFADYLVFAAGFGSRRHGLALDEKLWFARTVRPCPEDTAGRLKNHELSVRAPHRPPILTTLQNFHHGGATRGASFAA